MWQSSEESRLMQLLQESEEVAEVWGRRVLIRPRQYEISFFLVIFVLQ